MNLRPTVCLALMLVSLGLSGAVWGDYEYEPSEEAANRLELGQAKGMVKELFVHDLVGGIARYKSNIATVRFLPDYFELIAKEKIPAKDELDRMFAGGFAAGRYYYENMTKPKLRYETRLLNDDRLKISLDSKRQISRYVTFMDPYPWSGEKARLYADALYRLQLEYARANGPAAEMRFDEALKKYLSANPKPEFPEEARRFKVQAEAAVREKRFENAYERFSEALNIVPWWPEGRFNIALVLGELNSYKSAIREMKRYLQLVPGAPDARAAQDKIYEWEGRIGKP